MSEAQKYQRLRRMLKRLSAYYNRRGSFYNNKIKSLRIDIDDTKDTDPFTAVSLERSIVNYEIQKESQRNSQGLCDRLLRKF